jgi:hypothetical protein
MKLHLILLASLFNLSSGFMTEVKGPLGQEACTGDEYADFQTCITQGIAADSNLAGLIDIEDEAIVNRGGKRKKHCDVCPRSAHRGTWCFTLCGSTKMRPRRLEKGMNTPNLRRGPEADTAVFEKGAYTGNAEAILILEAMTTCLDNPCLGTTDTMTMTVTL